MSCPVCLDADINRVFSCQHGLCGECRSALRKAQCPLCRKNITEELSEEERKTIEERQKQDKEETEREELQMLRAQFEQDLPEQLLEYMVDFFTSALMRTTQQGSIEIALGEGSSIRVFTFNM